MSREILTVSWRETIGMLDAITELHEPDSYVSWVDRYGRMKKGKQYIFMADVDNPENVHENIVISEAEIGIQVQSFNLLTDRFNEIDYNSAYKFSRVAGGLVLTSVIIACDGQHIIPLTRDFRKILKPQDIIEDIHYVMSKGEDW